MIVHKCDRCKDEIPNNHERTYVIPKNQDGDFFVDMRLEYELCRICREKLKNFLEGAEYGK